MRIKSEDKSLDRAMAGDRLPMHDRIEERVLQDGNYQEENKNVLLDIPEGVYREGYQYFWARRDNKGASDFRLEELQRKAWLPVPAWRAPNYVTPNGLLDQMAKDYVCRADCILMERLSKYSKMEERANLTDYENRMRGLQGVSNIHNTPRDQHEMIGF